MKTIALRLPKELITELDKEAKEDMRSRNSYIYKLLTKRKLDNSSKV